ncbi:MULTISPECIES: ABC transporter permease [unclassified Chelatococcus]|uniref:ABC transporter permease n=1 Tax=unclassified Chelatococcus TaxID=2638111 RepID=UPI001BD1AF6C|nr:MULTISPECIES: ABC transporter permease [unclassified Chelatococcus]MBS7700263.1 ABC transporter permease [Chelatococcus sp. YT9]MBX3558234.1 ABC transporter permease [Chelatococcus sp.]
MRSYALKRLFLALLVAIAVSIISFSLLRLTGDAAVAIAGVSASPEAIEAVRRQYGLDQPLVIQYLAWLGRALTGDLGVSYFFNTPVVDILAKHLPVTLFLGACAIALAIVTAVPLGILSGLRPNSWVDRVALLIAVAGQALPSFWLALMFILYLGVQLRWLPISGDESWKHFVLPSIVLAYYAMPALMRMTRAGLIEVMGADYVRTARAKGLSQTAIVFRHALRNAIIPVVALAAVQFGFMLGGSIVVETVFALHGVGYLAWESIQRADIPVIQSIVLVMATIFVGLNLLADLANALLNPRLRSGR